MQFFHKDSDEFTYWFGTGDRGSGMDEDEDTFPLRLSI